MTADSLHQGTSGASHEPLRTVRNARWSNAALRRDSDLRCGAEAPNPNTETGSLQRSRPETRAPTHSPSSR